jgi:hypothetical protein
MDLDVLYGAAALRRRNYLMGCDSWNAETTYHDTVLAGRLPGARQIQPVPTGIMEQIPVCRKFRHTLNSRESRLDFGQPVNVHIPIAGFIRSTIEEVLNGNSFSKCSMGGNT